MTVTERTIAASPELVYGALIDPITYPRWLVGAKRIREVSPEWPATKSYFKHVVGFGPLTIADRTTVCDAEPPRMLELFVRARPLVEATVRFELFSHPTGCLIRMTETPSGLYKIASPLMQPLISARNERSLHRLDELVTSRLGVSPVLAGATDSGPGPSG